MIASRLKVLVKGAGAAALPLFVLAGLLIGAPGVLRAQSGNRAGLVVVHGDGRVTTRCVPFAEDSISGLTLLQRSGLSLEVSGGAGGATVCSIEGEGCPAADCFCQCKGTPCIYWNYFYRAQGGPWTYAALGAMGRTVQPGDVDGWVWGEGSNPPSNLDFAAICEAEAPAAQLSATPHATVVSPTPTATATSSPAPTATTTTAATTATAGITATVSNTTTTTPPATATPTSTPTSMQASTATPTPPAPVTVSVIASPTSSPTPATTVPPSSFPLQYLVYVLLIMGLGGAFWFVKQRGR